MDTERRAKRDGRRAKGEAGAKRAIAHIWLMYDTDVYQWQLEMKCPDQITLVKLHPIYRSQHSYLKATRYLKTFFPTRKIHEGSFQQHIKLRQEFMICIVSYVVIIENQASQVQKGRVETPNA